MALQSAATSWDPASMIVPDVVLPVQSLREGGERTGEFGLLRAILVDGIRTYCDEILRGRTTSLAYREVERWIFRPNSDVVTSFSALCDVFGIDSRQLRRWLLNFRENPQPGFFDSIAEAA